MDGAVTYSAETAEYSGIRGMGMLAIPSQGQRHVNIESNGRTRDLE